MADEADLAGDRLEIEKERSIRSIREAKPEALATGYCLECFEITPDGHRWCGPECRDMWQMKQDK